MAAVAKSAKASFDASTGMVAPQITGLVAGEAIASAVTPCRIHTDGKVYKASGAAADANARVAGWNTRGNIKAGQPVTLYGLGAVAKYSDGNLTPGALLYLGAAGALDTAATTGDALGVAQAIDADNIRIISR